MAPIVSADVPGGFWTPLQKYEIWLQLLRGGTTISEAADHWEVDRSTTVRLREVAKQGHWLRWPSHGRGRAPRSTTCSWRRPRRRRRDWRGAQGYVVDLVSYHAPPGVSWFEKKPQQAVRFARWLTTLIGPAAFGADANTPLVDAIDFQQTRTHWYTGRSILRGAPGDDLLVGPVKLHPLEDVLRRWLDEPAEELDRLRAERPRGPLALSYRTGRRKLHPGTDRRFDSIWVSPQFEVDGVAYPYAECIAAGSDHAAVVADLTLPRTRAGYQDVPGRHGWWCSPS